MKKWVKYTYLRILKSKYPPNKIMVGYYKDYLIMDRIKHISPRSDIDHVTTLQDFINTGAKYKKRIK